MNCMKDMNKVIPALLALVAAAGLAACGSSSGEEGNEAVSGQFKLVPGAPSDYRAVAGEATLERADGGTILLLRVTGLEPSTEYVAHLHSGSCEETDPGGPHFKFDPKGFDEPPNEIHLEFSSKADGATRARASSKREVPVGEAGSVVIHEAEPEQMTAGGDSDGETVLVHEGHHHEEQSQPEKIACAELEGGGSGTNGAGAGPTIVIRNGEPVGGIEELEYSAGDEIRFQVESDVADEVHVHGYDLMEDVSAGGEVAFDFAAEIEGIFEVELEGRKEQIAELRVNP
jgi:hypothetical protein